MNVAEFDKKWELLNQLAKQVSYQLQHKVPPPPEHQPLKLLFMTQKWIKQVLLSELVEVQRMVHGGAAEPRKRSAVSSEERAVDPRHLAFAHQSQSQLKAKTQPNLTERQTY